MRGRVDTWLWLGAAVLLAGALQAPRATAQTATESEVKAAYLLRFPSFVEWPPAASPQPGRPLVVGILQADEIHDALAVMAAGRGERPIIVRRVHGEEPLGELHVLFVGRRAAARLPALARQAAPSTLVVAEADGALESGATVNFLIVDGRVRFEIALERAAAAGLRVSPRMLAVAVRVKGTAP